MNNSSKYFLIPVALCLLFSLVWIPAENSFFADYLIKVKPDDSIQTVLKKLERQLWLTRAAKATNDWMSSWLMVWNDPGGFTVRNLISSVTHVFAHVGWLNSLIMVCTLGTFGYFVERRHGGRQFVLLFLGLLLLNAVAVIHFQPYGPTFGCWPLLAGFGASMLCSSNGMMRPDRSLVIRIVGLAFLLLTYFQLDLFGFSIAPRWESWFPMAAGGALFGIVTWCLPKQY